MTAVDWEFEIEVQRGVDGDEATRVVEGPAYDGFEEALEERVVEAATDLVRTQDELSEGDRLRVSVDVALDDVQYDNFRVSDDSAFQRYKWFPTEEGFVEVNRSLPWSEDGEA
jgi:hypothetical protein